MSWRRGGLAPGAARRLGRRVAALVAVVCWSAPAVQQLRSTIPATLTVLTPGGASADPKLGSQVGERQRLSPRDRAAPPWWLRGAARQRCSGSATSASPPAAFPTPSPPSRSSPTLAGAAALARARPAPARRRRAARRAGLGPGRGAGLSRRRPCPRTAFGTVGLQPVVGVRRWGSGRGCSSAGQWCHSAGECDSRARSSPSAGAWPSPQSAVGRPPWGSSRLSASGWRRTGTRRIRAGTGRCGASTNDWRATWTTAQQSGSRRRESSTSSSPRGSSHGVIWSLRRHGHGVTTTPASQFFGPRYRPTPDPVDVVRIDVDRAPPDGFVRVASVRIDRRNADNPFATGPEYRVVNVSVLRHRSAP